MRVTEKGGLPAARFQRNGFTMTITGRTAKADTDKRIVESLRIRERLSLRGLTFTYIDEHFKLSPGTARNTVREPNRSGEVAISAALGIEPHKLWPSRYLPTGQRKSPQDYSRPPTMRQRRKAAGRLS